MWEETSAVGRGSLHDPDALFQELMRCRSRDSPKVSLLMEQKSRSPPTTHVSYPFGARSSWLRGISQEENNDTEK